MRLLAAIVLGFGMLVPVHGAGAQIRTFDGAAPAGDGAATDLRRPPRVEPTDRYQGLVMTLILIVCVGATAAAVLIPGQRTHQD